MWKYGTFDFERKLWIYWFAQIAPWPNCSTFRFVCEHFLWWKVECCKIRCVVFELKRNAHIQTRRIRKYLCLDLFKMFECTILWRPISIHSQLHIEEVTRNSVRSCDAQRKPSINSSKMRRLHFSTRKKSWMIGIRNKLLLRYAPNYYDVRFRFLSYWTALNRGKL